ncbi:MAG: homoserine dehydrogenase [Candidatus Syntrophonatronum acetioxidans]|uniref:Homoserine dehydrogenase n=1 Tax=Candidatus Syntrophonatronum acetioxidans TaxID=1795816 RepID=A0A424YAX6_9FIRM|nr:MAG: homoserine dehydrogenase [Candidatus Syntrophonatronum acetioxidans]
MVENSINIGLLGCGTVGSGVVKIIKRNKEEIERKAGSRLNIKKVLVRSLEKERPLELAGAEVVTEIDSILEDPDIKVVIELIGGVDRAREYMEKALKKGKFVVTANKDLMAQHGKEIFQLAQDMGVNVYYEASVGGGIPLVRPLKHCLAANRIMRIMGIINGTTNYILTKMTLQGKAYQEALEEAQEKGFAEQDPSSDVLGKDAAYKLAILASIAFDSSIDMESIYMEGITEVKIRDIRYAEELGYKVKLLAIGERLEEGLALRVHPTLVPDKHPLAAVNDEFNAVFFEGDAVGEIMLYGRGAGEMPTGSAVVADVIEVARNINRQVDNGVMEVEFTPKPIMPLSRIHSKFYIRLKAIDEPGVFASLANIFSDEKVSLDMIIQKRRIEEMAEIVLVTHDIREENFFRSIERIKEIPSIKEISQLLRVV